VSNYYKLKIKKEKGSHVHYKEEELEDSDEQDAYIEEEGDILSDSE